jgi:uncharacterized protein YndB with AHSA1/START domain
MGTFGAAREIAASARRVFDFIAEPANMNRYLPTVQVAEGQGPGRVRVQGEVLGRRYDSDGWFDVDRNNLSMRWGSDGENAYSGEMVVTELDPHRCKVEVHLNFEPRPDQEEQFREQMGSREAVIQQGLDRALNSVRDLCEGKAGGVAANLEPGRTKKGYLG